MKLTKTKLQNGMVFWYREDDKVIGQRIALRKFEEYETLLMMSQVNINSVVVDVGANIGYYTLLLAKICKRVYAFEPDKDCFEILKKNVEENGVKNVVLFNKAVGDKNEKRGLIKDKNNQGNSRLISQRDCFANARNDVVEVVKLDDVIKEKVDLIKVDVQGFEEKVIEGAKKMVEMNSPVLFYEYNGGNLKFLKRIYKNNIWSIDYWFYICRKGIHIDKKTGYVDLWMKNKMSLGDYWWMVRMLQIKKVIKLIV